MALLSERVALHQGASVRDIAGIGVGGKGWTDITMCATEDIVALCDVDDARAAEAVVAAWLGAR